MDICGENSPCPREGEGYALKTGDGSIVPRGAKYNGFATQGVLEGPHPPSKQSDTQVMRTGFG